MSDRTHKVFLLNFAQKKLIIPSQPPLAFGRIFTHDSVTRHDVMRGARDVLTLFP